MYKLPDPIVYFKKTHPDATIPTYGYGGNTEAGVDLYSCEDVWVYAGCQCAVNTGIAWDPSPMLEDNNTHKVVMIVNSRSGLAFNNSIEASNAGIVDQSYRGEIKVLLRNFSDVDYQVNVGDRIAQGLVMYMPLLNIQEAVELSTTERDDKGFGSSGI